MNKPVCYAFIDGQNLYKSLQEQSITLDFRAFRKHLQKKNNATKAFYYIGYQPHNSELYRYLEGCGYELVFKEVSFEDDKVKGNIDAELIFTGMLWYNDYDKAIIISGDGDFIVFLKHLKEHKKLLKVILPNAFKTSQLIYKHVDGAYLVDIKALKKYYREDSERLPEGAIPAGELLS